MRKKSDDRFEEVCSITQSAKIGIGTFLTIAGTKEYIRGVLSKSSMEEALYRSLETVNMNTIMEAKQSLDAEWNNMGTYVVAGMIAVGAGLVASGIYNLAEKYHSKRQELKKSF
jgi:hypothetical protein